MTIVEWVAVAIAFAGVFGGLAKWALSATVRPLSVVIENNTKALDRITGKLDAHDATLDEHGERLVAIETKHKMRHPGE